MSNNYSASYDVDMARKYGLEAAALFNKLVYLSRYTAREDGFCWRTAKELEEELGISKFQQERATKILENAGLIETKVTYIQGTMARCKHFKLCGNYSLSESKETLLSVSQETSLSVSEETALSNNNNHTVIIKHNNKKENYKEKEQAVKHKHGEFKHVLLTEAEYERLVKDYGEEVVKRYIKKVDEYCEQHGKRYQNYNLALRNTFMKDVPKLKVNNDPNYDPATGGRLDF